MSQNESNRLLNVCFDIKEEVLIEAVIRLGDILDDRDANALRGTEDDSTEPALRELLEELCDAQNRFPMDED